jgi:hypothetical protein
MVRLSDSLALDYLLVDEAEAVTFRSRGAGATYTDTRVAVAWRQNLSSQEVEASRGAYTRSDKKLHLPKRLLTTRPKPADVVRTASDGDFTVLEVGESLGLRTWDLTCRSLAIVGGLGDLLTVERPTYAVDAAGVRKPSWSAAYVGIPCRLQPIMTDEAAERGLVGPATRYDLFVDRDLAVTTEDRALVAGVYYEVRRYRRAERLGELPALEVELVP